MHRENRNSKGLQGLDGTISVSEWHGVWVPRDMKMTRGMNGSSNMSNIKAITDAGYDNDTRYGTIYEWQDMNDTGYDWQKIWMTQNMNDTRFE